MPDAKTSLGAAYALVMWDDAQGGFTLRVLAPAGALGPARLAAFDVEPSWEGQSTLWVDVARVPAAGLPPEWVFDPTGAVGLERPAAELGVWHWLGRIELDPGPDRHRTLVFCLDAAGGLRIHVDGAVKAPPRVLAGPGATLVLERSANGPCSGWVAWFQSEGSPWPKPSETGDSSDNRAAPELSAASGWEPAAGPDAHVAGTFAALLSRPLSEAVAGLAALNPEGELGPAVAAARAVSPAAGQYAPYDGDGAVRCAWAEGLPTWVAFGPDGWLAAVNREGRAAVFRPDRAEPVAAASLDEPLERVLWAPDSRHVALAGRAGRIWVWPWRTGDAPRLAGGRPAPWTVRQSARPVTALVGVGAAHFAHDAGDGTVRLRRWPDGAEVGVLPGHERGVTALAAPSGGEWVAAGGGDGLVRVWRAADRRLVATLVSHVRAGHGMAAPVVALAASGDGRQLATASADGWVRWWQMPAGRLAATLSQGGERPVVLRFDPAGERLVGLDARGAYYRWDARGHAGVPVAAPGRAAGSGALDGVGALALVVDDEGRAVLWRGADGCTLGRFNPGGGRAVAGALSGDGRWAALLARDPDGLWIWPLFGVGRAWRRWGPGRLARPPLGDPGIARVVRALLEARFRGVPRYRPGNPGDRVKPVD